MTEINIQIGWEYLLGIVGSLIIIAWYSSARFTALETSMDWVKSTLSNLNVTSENDKLKFFAAHSPVKLTAAGGSFLNDSGIKSYVDRHKEELFNICGSKRNNPYEVQQCIFEYFDTIAFDEKFDKQIKDFAFEKGVSTDILRRIGAIYFRDICLEKFKMDINDIDKHKPKDHVQKISQTSR